MFPPVGLGRPCSSTAWMSETKGTLALHLTKGRVNLEEGFTCTAREITSSSPKISLAGMCKHGWPWETWPGDSRSFQQRLGLAAQNL